MEMMFTFDLSSSRTHHLSMDHPLGHPLLPPSSTPLAFRPSVGFLIMFYFIISLSVKTFSFVFPLSVPTDTASAIICSSRTINSCQELTHPHSGVSNEKIRFLSLVDFRYSHNHILLSSTISSDCSRWYFSAITLCYPLSMTTYDGMCYDRFPSTLPSLGSTFHSPGYYFFRLGLLHPTLVQNNR